MSHDIVSHWVQKAKAAGNEETSGDGEGIRVIRREEPRGKGAMIMEIAEILRPWLLKMLTGVRDNSGLVVQPATVRAIALNVAQDIVKEQAQA